jgi:hypothetical protein
MANHGDKGRSGRADVDLSESSVYGNEQTDLDGDELSTTDQIDRLEAITGDADEEPLVLDRKLRRQFDALDASTEEELDALELDLEQDGDPFDARDGSGRVDDDVAEEQIAAFTEVGPMADDRGGKSVAPGRDDTSAVLKRHRPHSEADDYSDADDDSDAILQGNIDPPLDEELDEDEPEHR